MHHLMRAWGTDRWLDEHVGAFRDALVAGGTRSEVFVVEDPPAAGAGGLAGPGHAGGGSAGPGRAAGSGATHPLAAYGTHAVPGDALVLHLGVEGLREALPDGAGPVVLDVHGLVDPAAVERWSPATARRSAATLDEIGRWHRQVVLALAPSAAEAVLLADRGVGPVAVVPGLVRPERVRVVPDERAWHRLRAAGEEPGATWVTVGPVGPASGLEDVIGGLWACRRLYDPAAHLHVVGPVAPAPLLVALRALCTELGLEDAVHWAGQVSPSLEAVYLEVADVVVDLGRADPWCVGTRRALAGGRPVLTTADGPAAAIAGAASGAAGGPGGLGGLGAGSTIAGPDAAGADGAGAAGGPLNGSGPAAVALGGRGAAVVGTAAHRLATDPALRARLAAAGRRRTAALAPSSLGASLAALVESALEGGAG